MLLNMQRLPMFPWGFPSASSHVTYMCSQTSATTASLMLPGAWRLCPNVFEGTCRRSRWCATSRRTS